MQRFGDQYHDHFQRALRSERGCGDSGRSASYALSLLSAAGVEVLPDGDEIEGMGMRQAPFSRLELLAWRALDGRQDVFAQAAACGDRLSMEAAARDGACFVALIENLRVPVDAAHE